MPHPRPNKAAEYRQQAEQIRTIARQISLSDTKNQLLDAAEHLEVLAADEERLQASPKPLVRG
ncbi:hypothetical protein KBI52_12270 [Microvirga sp. HBU67558]|uniref:hypothetical protein n=1 Tax=Microvirga sp. HBU67558 TaxID=2824562 RepID=UPI001B36A4B0|nr:hypothetical protein [Microvirga sp. HBU67558]MBQ0820982.1 hypothetical protein [Microvirga sp. HBU67558]